MQALSHGRQGAPPSAHERGVVSDVASQEIDSEILRGVKLYKVLSGFGRLLRIPLYKMGGIDAKTRMHGKSEMVSSLHAFLSHTWLASGIGKYIALLGYFRRMLLLCCVIAFALVFFALDVSGLLPPIGTYTTDILDWEGETQVGMWCASFPPFLGLLFFIASSQAATPVGKEPMVFLDQVCINQVDEEKMKKGIYSLAGFLKHSQSMLVLWSPEYFSRLWCVFELAAYLKMNSTGGDRIIFVPIFKEVTLFIIYCFLWLVNMLFTALSFLLAKNQALLAMSLMISWVIFSLLIAHRLRRFMEHKADLDRQLAIFDCTEAKCAVAEDYIFVQDSIVAWYGNPQAFNTMVRVELRAYMKRTLQAGQLNYFAALCASLPMVPNYLGYLSSFIKASVPPLELASFLWYAIGIVLLAMPNLIYMVFYIATRFGRKRASAAADIAFSIGLGFVQGLLLTLGMLSWVVAYKRHIAANAVFTVFWGVVTWLVFFRAARVDAAPAVIGGKCTVDASDSADTISI